MVRKEKPRATAEKLIAPSNLNLHRRVNFYEAGLGQEVNGVDWFTLLFEVIQLDSLSHHYCRSLSQLVRRSSFSSHEVCPQVDARAFRHLNQFPNLFPTKAHLNC